MQYEWLMYAWVSKYLWGLKSVFIYILLLAEGIKQINTNPHVLNIPIPFSHKYLQREYNHSFFLIFCAFCFYLPNAYLLIILQL